MKGYKMHDNLTLNYWVKYGWYVGKLKEVPDIFCQAKTLDDLKSKIQESYNINYNSEFNSINAIKMS
jgi:hypothetical protein